MDRAEMINDILGSMTDILIQQALEGDRQSVLAFVDNACYEMLKGMTDKDLQEEYEMYAPDDGDWLPEEE